MSTQNEHEPEIRLRPPSTKAPIHAIYRERDDGDWEFVAAYNVEEMDELCGMPEGAERWVAGLAQGMTDSEDNPVVCRVIEFDDPAQLVSVYPKDDGNAREVEPGRIVYHYGCGCKYWREIGQDEMARVVEVEHGCADCDGHNEHDHCDRQPQFNMLSPDKVPIRFKWFESSKEALEWAKNTWVPTFLHQGYYAKADGERVPYGELLGHLTLVDR